MSNQLEQIKLNMNGTGLEVLFPELEVINDEVNFGQPDLSFVKAAIKTAYEQQGKYTGDVSSVHLMDIEVEGGNDEFVATIIFQSF